MAEVRWLDDCQRIQRVLAMHGIGATLEQCESLWEDYSDMSAAGWLGLPGGDDTLYSCVSTFVQVCPHCGGKSIDGKQV